MKERPHVPQSEMLKQREYMKLVEAMTEQTARDCAAALAEVIRLEDARAPEKRKENEA